MQKNSESQNFRNSSFRKSFSGTATGSDYVTHGLCSSGSKQSFIRQMTCARLRQLETLLSLPWQGQDKAVTARLEYTRTLSQLNLGQDHQTLGLLFLSWKDSSGDKVIESPIKNKYNKPDPYSKAR